MVNEKDIFLDENNILGISSHIYFNTEQNKKLNFIEIFTNSEEKIKNRNTVIVSSSNKCNFKQKAKKLLMTFCLLTK